MNNGIQIAYPRTNDKKLGQVIYDVVYKKITEFMNMAKEPVQEQITYTLDMSHDEYEYSDYISIVFYSSMYTGGAHPKNEIITICYDKKKESIIDIEDLIRKNSALLEILSKESRRILSNNEKIVNAEMLINGTKPSKENFQNFAFTMTGLMLFFPSYQVASYSSAQFKIVIPYQNLKIGI